MLILEYHYPHSKSRILKTDLLNSMIGLINKIIFFILIPINIHPYMNTHMHQYFNFSEVQYHLVISIIVLDFAIYWQHRFFHMNNGLFKMHALHHTDEQLTVTSAFRFHIFELVLSLLYKHLVIFIFAIPYQDYIYYEALLLVMAVFNHSNIDLAKSIEKPLRMLIITPKTHRSHHDLNVKSQTRNFGNFLVFWDKIFKTYEYKETYRFGIINSPSPSKLLNLLKTPFKFK